MKKEIFTLIGGPMAGQTMEIEWGDTFWYTDDPVTGKDYYTPHTFGCPAFLDDGYSKVIGRVYIHSDIRNLKDTELFNLILKGYRNEKDS